MPGQFSNIAFLFAGILILNASWAQHHRDSVTDSLFIAEIEIGEQPVKVYHAEPLYIDLIRDLGARKGEREWNLGMGLTDNLAFDSYELLVEYEFAPVDRLGVEFEIPFTFFSANSGLPKDSVPSNRIEALQAALQWSFYVNRNAKTTMALGYLNELKFTDLDKIKDQNLFMSNVFSPFYVIAKRWGRNFHTLIYTGPEIELVFDSSTFDTSFQINTNIHYMLPGTKNFVGIEFNKEIHNGFDMVIRPQMRLDMTEQVMLGLVAGIPVDKGQERLSVFVRLIYEP